MKFTDDKGLFSLFAAPGIFTVVRSENAAGNVMHCIEPTVIVNKLLSSKRFALGSLLVIWALVRIYPVIQAEPLMEPEIWQARKLLDYGFVERHGGKLSPGFWTGKLPHPETFNYAHYPFPMFWLYTLIYVFSGPYGVFVFMLALKLAGLVVVFKVLDRCFERFAAWFASVLFAIAPCSMLLDMSTDLVPLGALLWPAGAWLLLRRQPAGTMPSSAKPWQGGGLMFLAGQVSWFTLAQIPAFMAMTADWTQPARTALKSLMKNRLARAMLVGGVVSFFFFLAQVVYYEPAVGGVISYIRFKMGSAGVQPMPRSALLTLFPLRTLLFVGAALLAGSVMALPFSRARWLPLTVGAWIYFGCFIFSALLLPHYFYVENMVYSSLLFPAAVLTALAVQTRGRWLTWALTGLAIPGVLYLHLYVSVPWITPTSRTIARLIAEHTAPTDVVLTNLKEAQSPYKFSDVYSAKATRVIADRHILFGFENPEQLQTDPLFTLTPEAPVVFLMSQLQPISPALAEKVRHDGKLLGTVKLSISPPEMTFAERLRSFVWYKVMRKARLPSTSSLPAAQEQTFEFYRLK